MNLVKYLLSEVVAKRLSKEDALSLMAQSKGSFLHRGKDLHPLLQENTSILGEQRFSSEFSGEEFFLSDHVIGGRRILPGVCYLEMARAAVSASTADGSMGRNGIRLKNVVWIAPIVVDDPRRIHIGLRSDGREGIAYEVYSLEYGRADESAEVIHSQGRADIVDAQKEAEFLDLAALRAGCDSVVEASQCYAMYSAAGMEYGATHRGLEALHVGVNGAGERYILAEVKLPRCVSETRDRFYLHPSVLDSALQAAIGMAPADSGSAGPSLPFALDEIEIFDRTPVHAYVYIRTSRNATDVEQTDLAKIQKLDIDICDENGSVCARLRGFTSLVMQGELSEESVETVFFERKWQAESLPAAVTASEGDGALEDRVMLMHENYKASVAVLRERLPGVQTGTMEGLGEEQGGRVSELGRQLFARIKGILQSKPKRGVLLQIVLPFDPGQGSLLTAVSGLLKSAQQENPNFRGQVIEVEPDCGAEALIRILQDNATVGPEDQEIRQVGGVREVARLMEKPAAVPEEGQAPWRDGGVYLIAGGAGGLGLIFTREIATRVSGARIVLTGRSVLSEAKRDRIEALRTKGALVEYLELDVSDEAAVRACIESVTARHGKLNGVIHAAGVIRDNFLIKKTAEEFHSVLMPKVWGTINLDRATADLPLDFFILFSSAVGVLGNMGQGDYALGNAFMDRYAGYRRELVKQGKRWGRTLAINWPLWSEGGMRVDGMMVAQMQRRGWYPLPTESGIAALYAAYASGESQVIVLEGNPGVLRLLMKVESRVKMPSPKLPVPDVSPSPSAETQPSEAVGGDLRAKVEQYLKKLLAKTLKLSADRIESDAPLEKYGIDSLLAVQMVNVLEMSFGSLPKTLFFEYQSIEAVADYFIENHRDALISNLKLAEQAGPRSAVRVETDAVRPAAERPAVPARLARPQRRRAQQDRQPVEALESESVDIAIIGVSGRYPQADNLKEFWENLKEGRDCITEIPESRWDCRRYYDPEKGKFGKAYCKWGGFIRGVDEFDPLFFNISPREAVGMDPQERLFLQCAYQTIEDAGYTRESLKSRRGSDLECNVGVFVGVMFEEYQLYGAQAQLLGQPYALSGNPASIANRVSYFCNFHGPSMAVDTMCSSSLTAIHLACRSLRNGECEAAIAGGVNVSVHPNKYLLLSQGQFASSTGRCKSFGEGGDGYVPGEGVGAVLLKPLQRAIADGDHIYAVIKATSINHGGKTNGYTVPNPQAQSQVIARALEDAKVNPRTISYVEAHGTGTSLGDPIEIAGLTKAFGRYTQDKQFCAIGSSKSNIGHCESAAGVAAVTKVLLQMRYRMLVPSLHSETLNPNIDFARTPFVVQRSLSEWQRPRIASNGQQKEYPRIAGISSYGAGGANAHVIVEEYIGAQAGMNPAAELGPERPALVVLSAKNDERLRDSAAQLLSHAEAEPLKDGDLADVAYTLQAGREEMEHRLAFSAATIAQLKEKLQGYLDGKAGRGEVDECYCGEAKKNREALSVINADDDTNSMIRAWMEKGKYSKLLELWAKGFSFDWNRLYAEAGYSSVKPRRISLPAYPFAKERYWIEQSSITISGRDSLDAPGTDAWRENIPELNGRTLDYDSGAVDGRGNASIGTAYFERQWQAEPLPSVEAAPGSEAFDRIILLHGRFNDRAEALQKQQPEARIEILEDFGGEAGARIEALGGRVFACVQGILKGKLKKSVLLQAVLPYDPGLDGLFSAVSGFLKSARQENPKFSGQVIEIEDPVPDETLVRILRDNAGAARPGDQEIRYLGGVREVARLKEQHLSLQSDLKDAGVYLISGGRSRQENVGSVWMGDQEIRYIGDMREVARLQEQLRLGQSHPWKDGGVYLITGGAGGLGQIFAADIAAKVSGARIILTGRSVLNETRRAQIEALQTNGARIEYRELDVSDETAVGTCLEYVIAECGKLDGVIHAAGVIRDNFIIKKTAEEFRAVLAPKVSGTINLDRATAELPLDCFVLFSSITGALGNVGQGDYAMANAFMDRYAEYRSNLVKEGKRKGRTVSINWPLWADGGMHLDEATLDQMKFLGLQPLATDAGISALYSAYWSEAPQVMVLSGDREAFGRWLDAKPSAGAQSVSDKAEPAPENTAPVEIDEESLKEIVLQRLKEALGGVAKLSLDKIDDREPLETYGIDSVMITQLNQILGFVFTGLPKTVFYEYPTLSRLAEYLVGEHRAACISWSGVRKKTAGAGAKRDERPRPPGQDAPRRAPATIRPPQQTPRPPDREGIAIIGLSGRYPQAENPNEFWENLKACRDGITEVPKDRWDWRAYYEADPEKAVAAGKMYCKWGGFVKDADKFDPLFFNMSPTEAEVIDPQERLFLEESWKVLEDAGYTRKTLRERIESEGGAIGVFGGVTTYSYQLLGGTSSTWSLTNRVSYLFNFNGPSVPVDTACSSALTAIHMACESLRKAECSVAIAGGVNLYLHPSKYATMCGMRMLSPSGRCRSFGAGGDGFVPGEGVGAVLLKPLSRAIADGDRIYGVIKGSAINHGGKTNGYTVPNPNAQAEVILEAIKASGVNPRTISYIEAHGTGTSLGDPIEIAGLQKAFGEFTQDKHFCSIGSVKSNIGHLESAAGIAGLTKILLQLKHRQLVPSLHSEVLNPNIDFGATPFYVQHELSDWEQPLVVEGGRERRCPRRAGLSSFGAGGANAHIVIEEWPEPKSERSEAAETTQLIVLSARNEERLKVYAESLAGHLDKEEPSTLAEIAFTLQVGREAMEERLAVLAESREELKEKLKQYLKGAPRIDHLYRGNIRAGKAVSNLVAGAGAGREFIRQLLREQGLSKPAQLWVSGFEIDWDLLRDESRPRRVSLPTYPFARDRHWVSAPDEALLKRIAAGGRSGAAALHPLLQENTSDLGEQRFSSEFSGEEFFLSDHVIGGRRILPGVCYLEMARAATAASAGSDGTGMRLKNVVWMTPVAVDEPRQVHIGLHPDEQGGIGYEVYSYAAGEDGEAAEVVHGQGRAYIGSAGEGEARLDLAALRAGCDSAVEAPQCYAAFSAAGMAYGAAHRGIERLELGCDAQGGRYVLAELKLPESVSGTRDQYRLHPSVLDSALQASIGLAFADPGSAGNGGPKPRLPFALEEIEILGSTPAHAYAYIRASRGGAAGHADSAGIEKLDIDLCDPSGAVCARLRGFTSRVPDGAAAKERMIGTLLLKRRWQAEALPVAAVEAGPFDRIIFLHGRFNEHAGAIQAHWPEAQIEIIEELGEDPVKRVSKLGLRLFERIRGILLEKPKRGVSLQAALPNDGGQDGLLPAVSGLLKSAQQENPKLGAQVIEIEGDVRAEALIQILRDNAGSAWLGAQEIRYAGGVRQVARLEEEPGGPQSAKPPWKDGGVYLITGGAGGLGLIFAEEITAKASGARIVLAGRSHLTPEKEEAIRGLRRNGAQAEYCELDVSDESAVGACIGGVIARHGKLDGVIHAAGVIRDNFLIKKTAEEFHFVLMPKVSGAINLDRATADLPLELFILFSSAAGALGNAGQGDYALANAFMDRYAQYREALAKEGKRKGRTLAINWPLWAEGGMHVDEATLAQMQRRGWHLLPTQAGIAALYAACAMGEPQAIVVAGDTAGIREQLGLQAAAARPGERKSLQSKKQQSVGAKAAESTEENKDEGAVDAGDLRQKIQNALIRMISEQLKVKAEDIDVEAELSEFGFDSISLTAFGNRLNELYGLELSPTIFFEYPTVAGFAAYLAGEHRELPAGKFSLRPQAKSSEALKSGFEEKRAAAGSVRRRKRFSAAPAAVGGAAEPIAIIGMSGCFPGAPDLDAFWANLAAGKDSITEIPKERWDWRALNGGSGEPDATSWGGFIDGVAEFDPLFFGISPREAELMDPQQRLLMTHTWKAIEDAGYSAQSLSGSRTGIFVGTAKSGYDELIAQALLPIEGYTSTGAVPSVGPNRMSFFLNLHGPSEPIETACSSSLVAIHRGVRAIHSGDCEMALVGGINTIVTPWAHLSFAKAGMLSADGRCKTFSKDADGYVRGEGAGMLFLKKLSAAERDGDHIYGVIRGSGENHGGRANSLTAPNPKAQAELIKAAYREARIDPRTVSYIEAHGTGTSLGDPIEINGLKSAFGELYRDPRLGEGALEGPHCGIGSVKTNIGHLELAAGVAGVIKVLLQLKHKTLVKSLHCEEINPYIRLEGSPFYLVRELRPWPAIARDGRELPRRAGISSFGFGGANAHVIVEEYRDPRAGAPPAIEVAPERPALIVLSAKDAERLREQVERLLNHLETAPLGDGDLADLAFTLQVGREAMDHRLALTATTMAQLKEKLKVCLEGKADKGGTEECYPGQVKRERETLSLFTADEELQEAVGKWVQRGKYAKLLELWAKGLSFDWNRLYNGDRPRRVSLPGYPFAKERYWVEPNRPVKSESPSAASGNGFDKANISTVIDSMLSGSIDIETAANKAMSIFSKS